MGDDGRWFWFRRRRHASSSVSPRYLRLNPTPRRRAQAPSERSDWPFVGEAGDGMLSSRNISDARQTHSSTESLSSASVTGRTGSISSTLRQRAKRPTRRRREIALSYSNPLCSILLDEAQGLPSPPAFPLRPNARLVSFYRRGVTSLKSSSGRGDNPAPLPAHAARSL